MGSIPHDATALENPSNESSLSVNFDFILAFFVGRLVLKLYGNFVADGLEFPIMLILFGSTRFVWEFFRDNSKLWLGCSNLAFHALFMFIVGLVAYIIIKMRLVMKHRNIKGSI